MFILVFSGVGEFLGKYFFTLSRGRRVIIFVCVGFYIVGFVDVVVLLWVKVVNW